MLRRWCGWLVVLITSLYMLCVRICVFHYHIINTHTHTDTTHVYHAPDLQFLGSLEEDEEGAEDERSPETTGR
jgi:hypothetical protein